MAKGCAAIAIVDTMTAIHATAAINAALYARRDTGKGQHVDLALYDTALACLGNMGSYYLIGGEQPKRAGNGHFASAPNSSFETSNGKIYMAVANQKLFGDTCKALGHPEWLTDPRFDTVANRVANEARTDAADGRGAEDRHQGELGEQAAPPAGRSDPHHEGGAGRARSEAPRHAEDLQAHARGRRAADRLQLPLLRPPVDDTRPPPALGEHTDSVLREIAGYSAAEVATLREEDYRLSQSFRI
jgi:crotonobetainyl-CoA:carnitine CoA-transferase CaiB-like acyl-CoA transferase